MKFLKSRFVISMTILASVLFFLLPLIADWIVSDPQYVKYAGRDAQRITSTVQEGMIYPFGKWLKGARLYWLVIPYFLILFSLVRYVLSKLKKYWKPITLGLSGILLFLYIFPGTLRLFENDQPSIARGTVANGSIENAKRMYYRGDNFTTYSFLCYLTGRTYVHDKVRQTMMDSYQTCEETCPEITFVIGEIGFRKGGHFAPHRTHRNGLSVDFMTPMLKNGKPYRSNHIFNVWGYRHEFDDKGINGAIEIDYETTAKHLLALEQSAKQNGLAIQKVIFDPVLRPYLLQTPTGRKIKHLPFTKNRVIVRHDDHYHVDFRIRK